ncbi:MAG: hypothetical protein ACE5HQ_04175 [Gemmatimonadota bacterium]
MPYIRTVPLEDATGVLKRQYDAAVKREGYVFHILSLQSLQPHALDASVRLYQTLMLRPGCLSRAVREMLATVTAGALDCFY